jgi:hypothetical protein
MAADVLGPGGLALKYTAVRVIDFNHNIFNDVVARLAAPITGRRVISAGSFVCSPKISFSPARGDFVPLYRICFMGRGTVLADECNPYLPMR